MNKLKIRSYTSKLISSNMYIMEKDKKAIIIDPCIDKEALLYIQEKSITIDYIILTHEHYDHISGVNCFKELFGCKVICNKECANAIEHPKLNFSKYFDVLIEVLPKDKDMTIPPEIEPYSCMADMVFEKEKTIDWKGHKIELVSTPGHSKGSICIIVDNKYLFSGDSLLRDYPTITRLKGGSYKIYKENTLEFFKFLLPETIVYPGHYESFKLIERINSSNI